MQTTLVFLVSTILLWWGCCNRSVSLKKRSHHRSHTSDETAAATAPVTSKTQIMKTIGEDALSKSRSIPRTSVINFNILMVF